MSAEESDYSSEFERAFRGAVQYALDTGFSDILEWKPVQEEALLHFIKREDVFAVLPTGCGKSLIFQLVPKVCAYFRNQGFGFPKAAILVVVCPLSALIGYHIQELKDHGISACSLADKDLTRSAGVSLLFSSFCSFSVIRAFSLNRQSPSKSFSNFSTSLLYFMHKMDKAMISLLTGNPNTDDNFAAKFCSLERTPSNKFNFPYPDIDKFILHT